MNGKHAQRIATIAALAGLCGWTLSAAQTPQPLAPIDGEPMPAEPPSLEPEQQERIANASALSLAEGIAQVRTFAEAGEVSAARAIADQLIAPRGVAGLRLEWWNAGGTLVRGLLDATSWLTEPLGWNGRPTSERALLFIERGLVSLDPAERRTAEADFGRALAVAPAGELRESASYDLALLPLLEGEEWRAQIPELGGTPPAPVPPAPGAQAEEPPDPLELARGAYLESRTRFIERLKLDWRDADTRANVELIQRRLRELDAIEKQREEQEQEQQDQQDQQQDGDQNQEQQENSEQQDQQDQQQPEEGEQDPQEGEQGDEQDQPEEQPAGDEAQYESQESEGEPQDAEPQEVHLSQEELQRLLNRLAEHEKEAEALHEMRRQRGSRGVDKDW